MQPPIQYAKTSDGVNIAYHSYGEGPPLVYLSPGGHLGLSWQYPGVRAWLDRLGAGRRVVRIDHRGSGLSDRDQPYDPQRGMLDVVAVVQKEKLKRFVLFGSLHTAPTAILFAHARPESVSHLVLWCPFAHHRRYFESSPPLQGAHAAAAKDWRTYTELMADLAIGWSDTDKARRLASYLREGGFTPEVEAAALRGFDEIDVTPQASELKMPVLVLQRREAAFPTLEVARQIASCLPAGRLVILEGPEVVPFLGDIDAEFSAIDEFLSEAGHDSRPEGLTYREVEILAHVAGGASNEAIARALSISLRTVERHISNIYLKTGVHNRAEATAYAYRFGIVSAP